MGVLVQESRALGRIVWAYVNIILDTKLNE